MRVSLVGWFLLLCGCASPFATVDAPMVVVPVPAVRPGDTWIYLQRNPYNGLVERTVTDTVVASAEGLVIERRSDRPTDPVHFEALAAPWREIAESEGPMRRTFDVPLARIALPIAPGQGWREQATVTDQYGVQFLWRTWGRALGWESVKTPAGEFAALRVERRMTLGDYDYAWSDTEVVETYWYAPAVRRWVRHEYQYERFELMVAPRAKRILTDRIVWELQAFRPAGDS